MKPKVISIVIPVFNNLALTKRCLLALKKNTDPKFLQDVLVVDDSSSDGTGEFLNTLVWIKKISNKKNLGFSKSSNVGAKKAEGEILVFLNNDTEVQRNWLEPLLATLEDERVAVVGSKLLFPDGKVQHAGIVISKDLFPRHIYYRFASVDPNVNKRREFQAVTAACMAIKRNIFEEAGGFDEGYINGMEDIDLCHKVREKGYKIFYCPESTVIHYESVSEGRFKHNFHNERLYFEKWGEKIRSDEKDFYKKDGISLFYIKKKELENTYLRVYAGRKPFIFKVKQIIFIFIYRVGKALTLLAKLRFKELHEKIKRVINDKS